ncbi:hypothetical protein [Streptomyces sp. UG1]|uniref:hypothetical protein n=1 Tax=Streptomyces sp. UG1 TaxID=3417652 RepID=UPI003CEC1DD7
MTDTNDLNDQDCIPPPNRPDEPLAASQAALGLGLHTAAGKPLDPAAADTDSPATGDPVPWSEYKARRRAERPSCPLCSSLADAGHHDRSCAIRTATQRRK